VLSLKEYNEAQKKRAEAWSRYDEMEKNYTTLNDRHKNLIQAWNTLKE
jgi:hypothetical protein